MYDLSTFDSSIDWYSSSHSRRPTMDEPEVKVERCVGIHGGGCKRDPWVVNNVEMIDGEEYIQLCKRD